MAATSGVTYTYGGNSTSVPHGKGRLLSVVSNGQSATAYTAYDALGRVVLSTQTTAARRTVSARTRTATPATATTSPGS